MNKKGSKCALLLGLGCIILAFAFLGYQVYKNIEFKESVRVENTSKEIVGSDNSAETDVSDIVLPEQMSDQEVDEVVENKSVLVIPKLDLQVQILEGTSSEVLSRGVGHYSNTVELGALGNCCIAGHSSATFSCIFNGLDTLEPLDLFFVYDDLGLKHCYYVTTSSIVAPSSTGVLQTEDDTVSQVTLITCAQAGLQRLIVIGKEFSQVELKEFKLSMLKGKVDMKSSTLVSSAVKTNTNKINVVSAVFKNLSEKVDSSVQNPTYTQGTRFKSNTYNDYELLYPFKLNYRFKKGGI